MTAKEKAKELIRKCSCILHGIDENVNFDVVVHDDAKFIALIAVNEVIDFEIRIVEQVEWLSIQAKRGFKCEGLFWEEVKKEILEL